MRRDPVARVRFYLKAGNPVQSEPGPSACSPLSQSALARVIDSPTWYSCFAMPAISSSAEAGSNTQDFLQRSALARACPLGPHGSEV